MMAFTITQAALHRAIEDVWQALTLGHHTAALGSLDTLATLLAPPAANQPRRDNPAPHPAPALPSPPLPGEQASAGESTGTAAPRGGAAPALALCKKRRASAAA